MNIGIYIYNDSEVLDFSGPFEVFATASRIAEEGPPFAVFLIGETGKMVQARAGYQITPNFSFANHPPLDVLIIAGGVHTEELKKPEVIQWIQLQDKQTQLTVSVCTGAFLLAEAGVVQNHQVTTHWEDVDDLQQSYPQLKVTKDRRWIDEGRIITSAGISAGIDMSLYLVKRLHSEELALRTARQMDYRWDKSS